MTFYKWSQTAASNATADATINWAEGQAPSSVNDSARGMMAAAAKWRDDIMGAGLLTAGSSTAYTLTSNQIFDTAAHMAAQTLSITVHATNGANPTLNVDGLGALPIVTDGSGAAVPAGTLIANSPYEFAFSNSSSHWRLKNFYVNPYNVPVGGGMLYFASTVPNSNFAFPNGAAISRATYSILFGLIGTQYGIGDGSTTFNLPDLRGRVPAGLDGGTSRLTGLLMTPDGNTLGATGGTQAWALSLGQLPTGITSSGANSISVTSTTANTVTGTVQSANVTGGADRALTSNGVNAAITSANAAQAIAVTSNNTSGQAHTNVQPTLSCNFIIRII